MLDGIGRDPPNPIHTCVVKMTPKRQYITWKNVPKRGMGTSKRIVPRRKSYEIKNLACFNEKLIVTFVLIHLETLGLIVFLLNLIKFFYIHALQIYCLGF